MSVNSFEDSIAERIRSEVVSSVLSDEVLS